MIRYLFTLFFVLISSIQYSIAGPTRFNTSKDYSSGHYHGQMVLSGTIKLRDGQGTMEYTSGAIYVGQWKSDKKHGKGEMRYKNGLVVRGSWKNDLNHGAALWTYPSGAIEMVTYNCGKIIKKTRLKEVNSLLNSKNKSTNTTKEKATDKIQKLAYYAYDNANNKYILNFVLNKTAKTFEIKIFDLNKKLVGKYNLTDIVLSYGRQNDYLYFYELSLKKNDGFSCTIESGDTYSGYVATYSWGKFSYYVYDVDLQKTNNILDIASQLGVISLLDWDTFNE